MCLSQEEKSLSTLTTAQEILSQRSIEDRAALAAIKQSCGEVAGFVSGQAYESLFKELLLVVDRLYTKDDDDGFSESAAEEILEICARRGLETVDTSSGLNLHVHEIVGVVSADAAESNNTIVEVVRNGYMLGEKLLRPASVVIARYNAEPPED